MLALIVGPLCQCTGIKMWLVVVGHHKCALPWARLVERQQRAQAEGSPRYGDKRMFSIAALLIDVNYLYQALAFIGQVLKPACCFLLLIRYVYVSTR